MLSVHIEKEMKATNVHYKDTIKHSFMGIFCKSYLARKMFLFGGPI